ncbi:hypothetical protein [Halocatena pleomorpha]|uniref:Uncharacterized protein n=1 Tax=Halocatena pleomorpha TaxID=1785090 RepID=A0A3P3RBZ0_9EURY|nr:hypothetical protein [Halocatena pleomorpha]RRJ30981.1 hypothetical protein EIK79_08185 [Halocatena pleomorpha]
MFETTTELVLETPVAVVALLPALYVTATVLWRVRKPFVILFMSLATVALFPVFLLFMIGEFIGSSTWLSFGTALFEFEASVLGGVLQLYDGVLAAWLRLCLLVIEGVLSVQLLPAQLQPADGAVLPAWLWAFVLHFAGGVMLVYGLYRGRSESRVDTVLRGGGGVLLVSGLFVAMIQGGSLTNDTSVTIVLLMAVIGLEIGVAAVLLGVQPDFSGSTGDHGEELTVQELGQSMWSWLTGLMGPSSDANDDR